MTLTCTCGKACAAVPVDGSRGGDWICMHCFQCGRDYWVEMSRARQPTIVRRLPDVIQSGAGVKLVT